ncbi:MAG TPA: shikimate kinase [Candidatus Binataceae bacterium]|nr:shikimate kinase [Candidatus Binataceae bacterium]
MAPKLILTGFMATGKSSIAPIVARRLGWPLIDSDDLIVARAGKPIAAIFADDGEPRFRALEREVIADLARPYPRCPMCGCPRPAVIATGGGALVDEHNFNALREAGVIVCLSARPEVIARRVERSRARRPKLLEGGKPLRERIVELIDERREAYERAEVTVDTSDFNVSEAANEVFNAFIRCGAKRCGLFA